MVAEADVEAGESGVSLDHPEKQVTLASGVSVVSEASRVYPAPQVRRVIQAHPARPDSLVNRVSKVHPALWVSWAHLDQTVYQAKTDTSGRREIAENRVCLAVLASRDLLA